MKYLNKFDTRSDYEASASTLEIPNVAYITATTEVIYNATQPKAYVVFADQAVGRKCVLLYSSDGVGCTEEDLGAVVSLNANDWKGSNGSPTPYTSFDELRYFTGLTSIPNSCFDYSPSLSSVTIPESVTQIGLYAFYESPLESITFEATTPPTFGNQVFHNQASTGNITVPSGSEANYYALAISLGENWTVNGQTPVVYVQFADPLVASKCATLYGDGTGCTMADLSAVTTMSASDWSGTSITNFDELQYFSGLTSIPTGLFHDCSGLTSVIIPDSVTYIDAGAFLRCTSLTNVTLGNSVSRLWLNAFYGCSALPDIIFPASVTRIDGTAFFNNSSLSSITFEATTLPATIASDAFNNLPTTGDITVPDGYESNFYSFAQSLGSGWIVNGLTPVNYVQFADPTVSSICVSNWSSDGTGCTEADLGAVTSLDNNFAGKTAITSFDEFQYFTGVSLDGNDFMTCSGMTSIILPPTLTATSEYMFANCLSLSSITIPSGVTTIGKGSFAACHSLTSVTIPSGVTSIGQEAFTYCTGLTSMTFNTTTPPTIGSDAFSNLPSTGNITVPVGSESNYFSLAQSLGSGWTVNGQTPS